MLVSMPQAAPQTREPAMESFAGLLASMALPASDPEPSWSDDGLVDDVATISYERALRSAARNQWPAAAQDPRAPDQSVQSQNSAEAASDSVNPAAPDVAADSSSVAPAVEHCTPAPNHTPRLKCSSVTIRMSEDECGQLRARAAESGLTVSAYLRSCVFEAEALRAMVKDALAQLRPQLAESVPLEKTAHSRFGWLRRFWRHARARNRAVRV
jgi:hypothetical protein